eukprot:scaffold76_cov363-Pavlova_lutheri.AAC.14
MHDLACICQQAPDPQHIRRVKPLSLHHRVDVFDLTLQGIFAAQPKVQESSLHVSIRDEAIQWIGVTLRGDECPRKVRAHLPGQVSPSRFSPSKLPVDSFNELCRLDGVFAVVGRCCQLCESVHPFGEVVEVLSVSFPFEFLIVRFLQLPLGQLLSYPQSSCRRLVPILAEPSFRFGIGAGAGETTPSFDPLLSQHSMDPFDEFHGRFFGFFFVPIDLEPTPVQSQQQAHRESVGPEVPGSAGSALPRLGYPRPLQERHDDRLGGTRRVRCGRHSWRLRATFPVHF